jgi:antitoxin (DNA-binding transcriptional repressor) of toxin-antitoxin stability system
MQFVTVRELRSQSAAVWQRLAEKGEMIITSNGKPVAILSAVSPDNFEQSLTAFRRARAVAAVESMQRRSLQLGADRMPLKEIEAEINAVRKGRVR